MINLPPQVIISTFQDFIELAIVNRPNEPEILKTIRAFTQSVSNNNYNVDLAMEYLNSNQTITIVELSLNQQYELKTKEQFMIQAGESVRGLFIAVLSGILMQRDKKIKFKTTMKAFQKINQLIDQLQKKQSSQSMESVIRLLKETNMTQNLIDFKQICYQLLQQTPQNSHLEQILNSNAVLAMNKSKDTFSILEEIQLIFLLQGHIDIEIQTILIIEPNSPEQKILTFNSSQGQNDFTVLFHLESHKIKHFLIMGNKIQVDMKSYLKRLVQGMNVNTDILISKYKLSTFDDGASREIITKQIKEQLMSSVSKGNRSVSPLGLAKRECIRCKLVFPIDLMNIGSLLSYYCDRCKQSIVQDKI